MNALHFAFAALLPLLQACASVAASRAAARDNARQRIVVTTADSGRRPGTLRSKQRAELAKPRPIRGERRPQRRRLGPRLIDARDRTPAR